MYSHLERQVEDVLKVLEDVKGRRPKSKIELFVWLTELDAHSRELCDLLEEQLGSQLFELWILGKGPAGSHSMDPEKADDCPECDNGQSHDSCREGWKDSLREANRARLMALVNNVEVIH